MGQIFSSCCGKAEAPPQPAASSAGQPERKLSAVYVTKGHEAAPDAAVPVEQLFVPPLRQSLDGGAASPPATVPIELAKVNVQFADVDSKNDDAGEGVKTNMSEDAEAVKVTIVEDKGVKVELQLVADPDNQDAGRVRVKIEEGRGVKVVLESNAKTEEVPSVRKVDITTVFKSMKKLKQKGHVSISEGRQVAFNTHMLAVALDYQGYPTDFSPLNAQVDAERLCNLAKLCGATDVRLLADGFGEDGETQRHDGWPTKSRIRNEWAAMVGRCQPGDTFVFFYSGHGAQDEDEYAVDEVDGYNEELCLCKPDGSYDPLVDDEMAALLYTIPDTVKVLVITDCCQSGSMCDLDVRDFEKRQIIHLSAAQDSQYAMDIGGGGALTCAMLEIIEAKVKEGAHPPSVTEIYNSCVERFGKSFEKGQQTMNIARSKHCRPGSMPFPLWPGKGSDFEVDTPLDVEGYDTFWGVEEEPQEPPEDEEDEWED